VRAALILWEITPAPKAELPPPPIAPAPAAPEPAVIPTPIDPASTGVVQAVVVDDQGRPIEGALTHIAAGLEGYVFDAHPQEEEALLLVLAHPFFDFSDRDGRVHLRGVPAGSLRVAAVLRDGIVAEAAVDLAPGAVADVRLSPPR
jgi:hypothetical protein